MAPSKAVICTSGLVLREKTSFILSSFGEKTFGIYSATGKQLSSCWIMMASLASKHKAETVTSYEPGLIILIVGRVDPVFHSYVAGKVCVTSSSMISPGHKVCEGPNATTGTLLSNAKVNA